jgi:hypothetical protein
MAHKSLRQVDGQDLNLLGYSPQRTCYVRNNVGVVFLLVNWGLNPFPGAVFPSCFFKAILGLFYQQFQL